MVLHPEYWNCSSHFFPEIWGYKGRFISAAFLALKELLTLNYVVHNSMSCISFVRITKKFLGEMEYANCQCISRKKKPSPRRKMEFQIIWHWCIRLSHSLPVNCKFCVCIHIYILKHDLPLVCWVCLKSCTKHYHRKMHCSQQLKNEES